MPSNQINPFNYNIDNFDSGILGPITDTNFRTYLFTHNLPVANSVISGVLGGNPWVDRATEYDVSMSLPNVVDVPNLQDVAQNPSLYNNLTNPRQVNLTSNLPNINPEVSNVLGVTTPILAGLGTDAASQMNLTTSVNDLPSAEDAALIPGPINNFTQPRKDNLDKNPTPLELNTWYPFEWTTIYNSNYDSLGTSYGVPSTLKIGFAGNIETWVSDGGYQTTTHEVRDIGLLARSSNKYGPSEIINYSYGGDEVVYGSTGFIEYNTQSGSDFRDQLLSRTLGVGVVPFSELGSGINYKPDGQNISDLDTIARKRRGVELKNRIKLNFTDNTIGALNVSPFSLLSGGNLIQQNYKITVPKSGIGKVLEFAADLAGFNLPVSIIPQGSFGGYGVDKNDVDITNDILDHTGSGQKSLLYNALYINKYGPKLESADNAPATGIKKFLKEKLGAGQAPSTQNYLTYTEPQKTNTNGRSTSIIDSINNKVKSLLNKSANNAPNKPDSTVDSDTSIDSILNNSGSGFDTLSNSANHPYHYTNNLVQFEAENPIGTEMSAEDIGKIPENYPSPERSGMYWGQNSPYKPKKGILKYTQDLVNKTTNDRKSGSRYIGLVNSDANYAISIHGGEKNTLHNLVSNGNTALETKWGNGVEEFGSYCRSWSVRRPYKHFNELVRSDNNWWKGQTETSTMTMNWRTQGENANVGMPKIAWTKEDNDAYKAAQIKNVVDATNPTKSSFRGLLVPYMFSIENLAWKDSPHFNELSPSERGPNGGRIMWFPPYDLNFTDSTSVSWDTTSFIGRGEPIYTYNHTERTGSLDFTVVVDHPEVLNTLRDNFGDTLNGDGYDSFFAGCDAESIKILFSGYQPDSERVQKTSDTTQTVTPTVETKPPTIPEGLVTDLKIYFENCRSSGIREGIDYSSPNGVGRAVSTEYENTVMCIAGPYAGQLQCINSSGGTYNSYIQVQPGGLNYKVFNNPGGLQLDMLAEFLATGEGKNFTIKVQGFTSAAQPTDTFNVQLAKDRADNTKKYLITKIIENEESYPDKLKLAGTNEYYPKESTLSDDLNRWVTEGIPTLENPIPCPPESSCKNAITGKDDCCDGDPCDKNLLPGQANSKVAKLARYAQITLQPNTVLQANILKNIQNAQNAEQLKALAEQEKTKAIDEAVNYYITESDYFVDMKKTDPFLYDSLTDRIKNFHPAFHAMTPEGLNSRLTFLQQCTRQGPQLGDLNLPQNMVFGRPPICVLRIGDFYHTKIVIDSCNFTFDPLVWDLNPEGIGVQPMIAKVSIGFKFIGGSSLGGPISQLQNAVSYNFFANTSVYNPARTLNAILGEKEKFVYSGTFGAFKSPEDVTNVTNASVIAGNELKNSLPVTSPDTTNTDAGMTKTETDEIDSAASDQLNNDQTTSQGDTKPATTAGVDNPSDDIATITKTDSGIQIQVNNTKWTLLGVEVDIVDNTGPISILSKAYGGNFDQDVVTNTELHDKIILSFDNCPGKDCTLFEAVTGNVSPNINCTYIISVTEKDAAIFPNGQKKTYNATNTIKI